MKLLVLTILLVWHNPVFGQKLSFKGTIIDQESGNPVEDVNIFISGTRIGTTSDSTGVFEINELSLGYIELVFSHVSYKNYIGRYLPSLPNSDGFNVVKLKPRTFELKEVLIEK